jgi:hypothetical protein
VNSRRFVGQLLVSSATVAAIAVCACTAGKTTSGGGSNCNGVDTNAAFADEATSIFVSPDASDIQGDGTRAHPLKSITQALAKVEGQRRHIYACGAAYDEVVSTTPAHAGLVFVGGYDCATWARNGARVTIGTGNAGPPIVVSKAEAPLTFAGIEAHATSGGASPHSARPAEVS